MARRGGQEPLRHVVATAFCVRWGRWVRARVYSGGLGGLLPDTDEAVGWCRVWLALVDHAPRDARVADLVKGIRCQGREEIAGLLAADPGSDRVAGRADSRGRQLLAPGCLSTSDGNRPVLSDVTLVT